MFPSVLERRAFGIMRKKVADAIVIKSQKEEEEEKRGGAGGGEGVPSGPQRLPAGGARMKPL